MKQRAKDHGFYKEEGEICLSCEKEEEYGAALCCELGI